MDDPLSVTVPLTASPMRLPVLICDEEQQGAQSSTGVTPRLTGVSLAADMPPWVLMQPSPSAKSPSGSKSPSCKSPRSSEGGSSGISKTPRLSEGADAPSSLRTSRDLDADVEAAHEAVLLEGAEDALTTATGAEATAGQGGSKSVAAPGEGRDSSDDDDDEEESGSDEDDMLQRLTAAAMRRGTQSPRRSAPTTPIAPGSLGRKSTPRLLTKAASTEGGEPVEEGWDAVAPRRRASTTPGGTPAGGDGSVAEGIASSAEGGSAPHSAGQAAQAGATAATPPATGSGGGAGSACPVSDNEDDAAYDAYSAAKDGSRRRIGKHGRNAREARSREFSMQARGAQRAGAS